MRRGRAGIAVAVGAIGLLTSPAWAGGEMERDMRVRASVQGELTPGERITFRVTATHPDGWAALHEIDLTLRLRNVPLETVVYDVDDARLSIGTARVVAGTANRLEGEFLRTSGLDVSLSTQGRRARLVLQAEVTSPLPEGTDLVATVTDDEGDRVSSARRALLPVAGGGFPLATLIGAAVVALVVGGVLGGRVASHRRPAERPSIYAAVGRRLEDTRPGEHTEPRER